MPDSVTACLHFVNQTPFDWYCKKQSTVETATYGAESTAARTSIEQMRANKMTFMYLGVPIVGPSVLFGDNRTVVDSGTIPYAKLKKRHLMLSYHYVREAIASKAYIYAFIKYYPQASVSCKDGVIKIQYLLLSLSVLSVNVL